MLDFNGSHNEVEYEVLLAGHRLSMELSIMKLVIHFNSQLITNQTFGEYMARHLHMVFYLDKVQKILKVFFSLRSYVHPLCRELTCKLNELGLNFGLPALMLYSGGILIQA